MKKILMLLVPVFCLGLFVVGCAPPETKPKDKAAPVAKEPAKDAPAPAKEEKK